MFRCFRLKRLIAAVSALLVLLGAGFALIPTFADNSAEAPVSLPVIMYHSVCEKEPSPYTVTPRQLESDLAWLSDNGFESVTAEQLISYTRGVGKLPEKPVLITFDDGFYNNLSLALPLLEKYDMTAVVSIVGRYTDDYAAADPHADSYSYLTWDDVSELLSSGRIEIGSHTYDLRGLSGNALWGEFLLGLKVNIAGNWSLGWEAKYHGLFKYKKSDNGKPWYIPGYGSRNSKWAFGLSVYYTLPLSRDRWPVVEKNAPSKK